MLSRHSKNKTTLRAMVALAACVTLSANVARADDDDDHKSHHSTPTPTKTYAACGTGIVIDAPGYYVLDAAGAGLRLVDCTFSTSGKNGIEITASNVTLSLNNQRVQFIASPGSGATPGVGILVQSKDTSTLRNVKIKGAGALVAWNVGIKFVNVDKGTADGVTTANNRTAGIETDGVTRFVLTDSMMARNGTYGLKLRNSVEGRVRGNTISANGIRTTTCGPTTLPVCDPARLDVFVNIWPNPAPGIGLGVHGGSGNRVERNRVTGNFGDGIAVGKFLAADPDSSNSSGNEISDNLTSGNLSSTGGSFTNLFVAKGSLGNQIHDNEALNLEDDNVACGSNAWYNNTFITTYSANGSSTPTPPAGTINDPLSKQSGSVRPWVDTGSASCAR